MLLSTPVKIFAAALFLSLIFAGCSLWRSNDNTASVTAIRPRNELPFSTREPDVFQAQIVMRTGDVERRITVAREGQKRRVDYDPGTDEHRAILMTDKEYLIFFKTKRYTARELSAGGSGPDNKLLSHLLNVRDYTDFEEVGRTGSVVEYHARVNGSDASEIKIFVDESIGLPVRQEFFSVSADERALRYSVELRDFRLEVDPEVFQVPEGFRREVDR